MKGRGKRREVRSEREEGRSEKFMKWPISKKSNLFTSYVLRLTSYFSPGFTLLEIMIAMAILSISLLSLYSAIGNSLRASGMAEEMDIAMLLARQKMTEVSISFDDDIAKGSFPEEKEEHGTFDKPFDRFKWTYVLKKVEIPVVNPPPDTGGGAGGTGSGGSTGGGSTGGGAGAPTTPGIEQAASNMAQIVSKKIAESVRELKLTISWGEGENEEDLEKVVLTTHVVKLK